MKNFLLLVITIPIMFLLSCKDDPINVEPEIKSLTTETKKLEFPQEGTTRSFTVSHQNVNWRIEVSDNWIEYDRQTPAGDAGTVQKTTVGVKLGEGPDEGRTGKITLKADGVPDLEIEVSQLAKGVQPEIIFEADTDKLEFDADGETKEFNLTVKNVEWDVKVSADWIEWEEAATSGGTDGEVYYTLAVSLDEGPDEGREGKFTIVAEGQPDIEIAVTQKERSVEPEVFFWEQNSLARMNYHGNVRFATSHFNFNESIAMFDLEFNRDGWLTYFERDVSETVTMEINISYDAQNRINRITAESTHHDTEIVFNYGSHGKYIPMEEIFYYLSFDAVLDYMAWCPQFIKDLESIEVRNMDEEATFTVDIAAGEIKIEAFGNEEVFCTMEFNGDIPAKVITTGTYGLDITIEMDPETGKLLKYQTDEYFGFAHRIYADNRMNTMTSIGGTFEQYEMAYNDNLDLTEKKDLKYPQYNIVVSYDTYDQQGNWTKLTSDGEVFQRSILYR